MEKRHGLVLVPTVLLVIAFVAQGCLSAMPAAVELLPTPTITPTATTGPTPTIGPAPTTNPVPAATAAPVATPAPKPTPTAPPVLDPVAAAGPFQMDLYRPKSAVRQLTTQMCVGAAMQTMINLMAAGEPDRSDATQLTLFDVARQLSRRIPSSLPGASPRGWAAGLDFEGYADYEILSSFSMDEVLKIAARQMRFTHKPVGLTVWRGKHALVMSGFEATADPGWTDDFTVTAVWIEDPWFGRIDSRWGAGLAPDTLVSRADLGNDFVSWVSYYLMPNYNEARFIIVAPIS